MKIAFWSNDNDVCQVSANMAAVSVASVIRYPYTVIAMENRLCNNNLGKAYLGINHAEAFHEPGTGYYDGGGIEGLMRKIYRGLCHPDILEAYVKEVISEHLYYIPQSKVIHGEVFDYELEGCIHPFLDMMEEFADISFIDTASKNNLSTKVILEKADLIVVNLCQRQGILEDFFLNYSSLIPRAVFIMSNYDSHNALTLKRISCTYELPWDRIIAIPYNPLYHNAFMNGNVVEYISWNYSCLQDNPNFLFIHSLKKAAHMIIKKAAGSVKDKEKKLCLH